MQKNKDQEQKRNLPNPNSHSFNRFCRKANLFHLVDTTAFEFVESYITESDMLIGEEPIKKGSWLAKIYVNKSDVGDLVWEIYA